MIIDFIYSKYSSLLKAAGTGDTNIEYMEYRQGVISCTAHQHYMITILKDLNGYIDCIFIDFVTSYQKRNTQFKNEDNNYTFFIVWCLLCKIKTPN